ncbi:MAG: rhodanese-like domain-containing protein [Pyrinomonadaceae bacterium]
MKRRLFLVTLLACAALSGTRASAQVPPQEVPPDRVALEEFTRLRAASQVFVLDVRYQIDKKIKGARHIPLEQLEARLAELPRDREIVTYCS